MTLRAAILAFLVAATPSLAAAQQGSGQQAAVPSADAVAAMLSGFEDAPSLEAWRAMGPDVVPILARLADDPQQPGFVRLRAIQAAAAFSTASSRAMLRRAIRGRDPMAVREAALAMARAFGRGAIADVEPLLAHRDVAVREGAIRALGSIDDEAARRILRARLARETDPVLRDEIARCVSGGCVVTGGVGAARDG